jgi:hypothetical protein
LASVSFQRPLRSRKQNYCNNCYKQEIISKKKKGVCEESGHPAHGCAVRTYLPEKIDGRNEYHAGGYAGHDDKQIGGKCETRIEKNTRGYVNKG